MCVLETVLYKKKKKETSVKVKDHSMDLATPLCMQVCTKLKNISDTPSANKLLCCARVKSHDTFTPRTANSALRITRKFLRDRPHE